MTMLCPRLVGREAELDLVDRRLAAARRGQGVAIAVAGEARVGKSRLVRELASRARMGGSTVLVG